MKNFDGYSNTQFWQKFNWIRTSNLSWISQFVFHCENEWAVQRILVSLNQITMFRRQIIQNNFVELPNTLW